MGSFITDSISLAKKKSLFQSLLCISLGKFYFFSLLSKFSYLYTIILLLSLSVCRKKSTGLDMNMVLPCFGGIAFTQDQLFKASQTP